jgi:hypothetical protein
MTHLNHIIATLVLLVQAILANVEKTIFLGPATVNVPLSYSTLEDLHINTLTPQNWSLRTQLEAQFPTALQQNGKYTWLLLDRVTSGQRYEVRVCWAAAVSSYLHRYIYLSTYTTSQLPSERPVPSNRQLPTATDRIHTRHLHFTYGLGDPRAHHLPLGVLHVATAGLKRRRQA